MFDHYRSSNPNPKVDSTSNTLTDDNTRGVGNKRRMRTPEEIFGVHATKLLPMVTSPASPNSNKTSANVHTVHSSRVEMCSTFDLPEQDHEPGYLFIDVSATEVTYTIAPTKTEDICSFSSLRTVRPTPRSWTFVEWSRPIISLSKQDKPNVNQIHVQNLFTAQRPWRRTHPGLNGSLAAAGSKSRTW